MDELLQALAILNNELRDEDTALELNVIGGFALYLQNLGIEVRHTNDIDSVSLLSESVKKRVQRIGRELGIDLHWLNDDVLSLYDEFQTAGIDLEQLHYERSTVLDLSNIHLSMIDVHGFLKLKLFAIFLEVHDYLQYNNRFDRDQDLSDVKLVALVNDIDLLVILDETTSYVHDPRYRNATRLLLGAYMHETLTNDQVNELLQASRDDVRSQ